MANATYCNVPLHEVTVEKNRKIKQELQRATESILFPFSVQSAKSQ